MRQKRLNCNQVEIIETYLPEKLQEDKMLDNSMKLVLAKIYELYYLDNNKGKRTVFYSNKMFMKDIDVNDKSQLVRPVQRLIDKNYITKETGYRNSYMSEATKYTLSDDCYALLPDAFKSKATHRGQITNATLNESKATHTKSTYEGIIEENNALRLKISELEKKIELLENTLKNSKAPSDSDSDTDKEAISVNTMSYDTYPSNDNDKHIALNKPEVSYNISHSQGPGSVKRTKRTVIGQFSKIISNLDKFTDRLNVNLGDTDALKNAIASLKFYKAHSSEATESQRRIVKDKIYRFLETAKHFRLMSDEERLLLDPRSDEYSISMGNKLQFTLAKCKKHMRDKFNGGDNNMEEISDELNRYMDVYSIGLERNREMYFNAVMRYIRDGYTETVTETHDNEIF